MRRGDVIVFDEYIIGATSTAPVYTPASLNETLGSWDTLAICAVVDQASAAGSLFVALEHSADGRLWLAKNPSALEINALNNAFVTTGQTAMWGYSKGTSPALGQARLKIYFNSSSINAHVRVHVTMRDPR